MGALFSALYLFESLVGDQYSFTLIATLPKIVATILIVIALQRLQNFDWVIIPSRASVYVFIRRWIGNLQPYFGYGNRLDTATVLLRNSLAARMIAALRNNTNAGG